VTVRSAAAPPCMPTIEQGQPGPENQQFLNIGTGVDLPILELAEEVVGADYTVIQRPADDPCMVVSAVGFTTRRPASVEPGG